MSDGHEGTEAFVFLLKIFFQAGILFLVSIVVVICGGVFWSKSNIGNINNDLQSLVSLPLTPSYENPRDIYIVSNLTSHSIYDNNNFSINYPVTISTRTTISFYIIHNMFGYSINMSTHVDEEETNIKVDFNTNPENITSIEFRYFNQLDLDTSIFRVDGDYFKVWCPSSSLITKHYGIDQKCFAGEYPMKIDGKYTVSYIGEGKISETQNIIDFYNSTFILNNYIDTPQAFLCAGFSGEASSPAWKIVTIVFIVISSLALIEIIAVIVCCNIKV